MQGPHDVSPSDNTEITQKNFKNESREFQNDIPDKIKANIDALLEEFQLGTPPAHPPSLSRGAGKEVQFEKIKQLRGTHFHQRAQAPAERTYHAPVFNMTAALPKHTRAHIWFQLCFTNPYNEDIKKTLRISAWAAIIELEGTEEPFSGSLIGEMFSPDGSNYEEQFRFTARQALLRARELGAEYDWVLHVSRDGLEEQLVFDEEDLKLIEQLAEDGLDTAGILSLIHI